MPTILLQEIRDFLYAVLTAIRSIIEHIDTTLDAIKEDTENLNVLPEINDSLNNIEADTATIKDAVIDDIVPTLSSIDTNTGNTATNTASIDNKTTTVLQDLNTIINTNTDIKNNTGALVTPTARISENTSSILINTNNIRSDVDDIKQRSAVIASNTGATSAYCDDIATNTLNIYNKISTISEDTTQMRGDNQVIIDLLQDILTAIGGTH